MKKMAWQPEPSIPLAWFLSDDGNVQSTDDAFFSYHDNMTEDDDAETDVDALLNHT